MRSGNEYEPNQSMAIIIVGNPGTRKTSLALQFPNPYFFDADNNLSGPVRHLNRPGFKYDLASIDENGKEILPPKRYAHFVKCLGVAADDPDVDWIVIDSLTSFVDILKIETLRQANKKWDDTMTIPDWGRFAFLVKHVIMQLRLTSKGLILTAHNKRIQDEATKTFMHFINIDGGSKDIISGVFTDCWETYTDTKMVGGKAVTKYMIRTQPMNNADQRGIKSSIDLPVTFEHSIAPIAKALDFTPNVGTYAAL